MLYCGEVVGRMSRSRGLGPGLARRRPVARATSTTSKRPLILGPPLGPPDDAAAEHRWLSDFTHHGRDRDLGRRGSSDPYLAICRILEGRSPRIPAQPPIRPPSSGFALRLTLCYNIGPLRHFAVRCARYDTWLGRLP